MKYLPFFNLRTNVESYNKGNKFIRPLMDFIYN